MNTPDTNPTDPAASSIIALAESLPAPKAPAGRGVQARKARAPRESKVLSKGARLDQFSAEVRRTAACVLEVLAGVRTPQEAAVALNLTLPTYYNLEVRALRGLIAGCGPVIPGGSMVLTNKLKGAQQRVIRLEVQVQRYQALLRAAQRQVGLAAPAGPAGASGEKTSAKGGAASTKRGGKRRRRPTARGLRAAAAMRAQPVSPTHTTPPAGEPTPPSAAV